MLSLDDLHTLKQIVLDGELGSVNYNRELIAAKLDDSISFYCDTEFTLSTLNSTKNPLLVFRDAHHKIVLSEKLTPIPKTPAHLYEALGTDDVPTLIHQRAMVTRRQVQSAPPDQCTWHIGAYKDAFRLELNQGYCFARECWLQAGNRESPGHMDAGRVLAYIPPSL
ncbi:hypothetical protein ON010_g1697 [Phytophthora cinnamomi]|nr:hypothetical protein ON010_g1697 [Phytophthora cinnamomi]